MRRVDIHSHLFPDAVFARLPKGLIAERFPARDQVGVRAVDGPSAGRGAPIAVRDVAAHRRVREAHRVDVAILSAWNKLTAVTEDPDLEAELCRVVNQELAAATQAGPDAYLASLPVADGARAADELSRAIGEGAVGGLLTANPHRGLLDRADLAHLWRTAEALGAPLLVHPSYFVAPPRLRDGEFSNAVGYPFETTLAAASLLAAGVPDRFPDLRLILVHGGGFLPYQYGRVVAGLTRHGGRRLPRAGLDYVRWFYFDTAQLEGPALRYLLDLVGPSRVLAGTDCPLAMCDFSIIDDPAQFGLGPEESAQVLGGNADRLFQLDRSTSARTAS
ncbi:MAG UNVERIFIED_CONTAM: amidohydrolase [Thermobifida fusca]